MSSIMEGPGSNLEALEMPGFPDIGLVSTLFEDPNSNMHVKIGDIQERPQAVETFNHLNKNNCQASKQLATVGVSPFQDGCTYFTNGYKIEDHCYVTMPTQEIDCSTLIGIDEKEFLQECIEIPKVDKLHSAENDSRCFETVREEIFAGNHEKNSEPEFISLKCGKKKNPNYLVSYTVQYLNDAYTICCK